MSTVGASSSQHSITPQEFKKPDSNDQTRILKTDAGSIHSNAQNTGSARPSDADSTISQEFKKPNPNDQTLILNTGTGSIPSNDTRNTSNSVHMRDHYNKETDDKKDASQLDPETQRIINSAVHLHTNLGAGSHTQS
jgi:hypothetical protein